MNNIKVGTAVKFNHDFDEFGIVIEVDHETTPDYPYRIMFLGQDDKLDAGWFRYGVFDVLPDKQVSGIADTWMDAIKSHTRFKQMSFKDYVEYLHTFADEHSGEISEIAKESELRLLRWEEMNAEYRKKVLDETPMIEVREQLLINIFGEDCDEAPDMILR